MSSVFRCSFLVPPAGTRQDVFPVWPALPPLNLQTFIGGANSSLPFNTYLKAYFQEVSFRSSHMSTMKRLIFSDPSEFLLLLVCHSYLWYIPYVAFMYGLNLLICFTPNILRKLHVTEAYATTQERLCLLTQLAVPTK